MYKLLIICLLLTSAGAEAQTGVLLPDQNPNYLQSQEKYTKLKDSLLIYSNSTSQQTYQAFDWYQDKLNRRNDRRTYRRQNQWSYPSFGYTNYGWDQYGYYNPYRYGHLRTWIRPSIGFRTGNWFFGF
ncbi:MAG TPA: hypothetical protein VJ552_08730 [Sediminibacterium sp.]|nr:hypothetical protein [Sediminibacterium sp.]